MRIVTSCHQPKGRGTRNQGMKLPGAMTPNQPLPACKVYSLATCRQLSGRGVYYPGGEPDIHPVLTSPSPYIHEQQPSGLTGLHTLPFLTMRPGKRFARRQAKQLYLV